MEVNLHKFWEIVEDRWAWHATVHGVSKNWTWLSHWTTVLHSLALQGMISNIHKDNFFFFFLVWENHTFSSSRSFLAWLESPCIALASFPSGWGLSPWIAYFWLFWFLSHLTAGESRVVYRAVFLICWLVLHHCLFRWLAPREGRQCISHPCQWSYRPNTCSTSGYRKLGPNFRTEEVLTFQSKQEDGSPEFPMLPFPHRVQGSLQAKHFSGSTQFRVYPKTPVGWSPGSLPTRSRESQNTVSLAASRQPHQLGWTINPLVPGDSMGWN